MWIVFGWEKELKPLGEVCTAYCYDCRRRSAWLIAKESEWVTLSAIRVLRFVCKHRLHCTSCSATLPLASAEFRQIDRHMHTHDSIEGTAMHAALGKRIEATQLAGKTPQQLRFIRASMQALEQYEASIKTQNERDARSREP
ncbi:MAG TPA: hypothetical protein VKB34_07500 [Povalibacter sp.]|nr:hypothetical protein [Povalibacter sp.]